MDSYLASAVLILILLGALYYIISPFLSEKKELNGEPAADQTVALKLRKVDLYKQIKEAEFERDMGFINENDSTRTKTELVSEVAGVMAELDNSSGNLTSPGKTGESPACPSCGTIIEAGASFCTQCGTAVGNTCPDCGTLVMPGDRFCASCGRGLL